MNRLAPAGDTPALLATCTALFEIGKLPQVVDFVEGANLDEPSCCRVSFRSTPMYSVEPIRTSYTLHDFSPRTQTLLPVRLPLQQVAGVERVASELKDTAQLARW